MNKSLPDVDSEQDEDEEAKIPEQHAVEVVNGADQDKLQQAIQLIFGADKAIDNSEGLHIDATMAAEYAMATLERAESIESGDELLKQTPQALLLRRNGKCIAAMLGEMDYTGAGPNTIGVPEWLKLQPVLCLNYRPPKFDQTLIKLDGRKHMDCILSETEKTSLQKAFHLNLDGVEIGGCNSHGILAYFRGNLEWSIVRQIGAFGAVGSTINREIHYHQRVHMWCPDVLDTDKLTEQKIR